jgi:AcrR family transcriptional regulator
VTAAERTPTPLKPSDPQEETVRPRTPHHGGLRTALIDAAAMLIAEKGVEALSVAEITRRLGVAGSSPYRHFSSREALLAATAAQTGRQLAKDMKAAVRKATGRSEAGPDATEALAATAVAYVKFVARHRAGVDFIFADELTRLHHAELTDAGRAVMDVLLPLTMSVAGDHVTALRLLERHIAAAHGLGALYINGFARSGAGSIDTVAADAAQITRVLAAAAAHDGIPTSISITPTAS